MRQDEGAVAEQLEQRRKAHESAGRAAQHQPARRGEARGQRAGRLDVGRRRQRRARARRQADVVAVEPHAGGERQPLVESALVFNAEPRRSAAPRTPACAGNSRWAGQHSSARASPSTANLMTPKRHAHAREQPLGQRLRFADAGRMGRPLAERIGEGEPLSAATSTPARAHARCARRRRRRRGRRAVASSRCSVPGGGAERRALRLQKPWVPTRQWRPAMVASTAPLIEAVVVARGDAIVALIEAACRRCRSS